MAHTVHECHHATEEMGGTYDPQVQHFSSPFKLENFALNTLLTSI